MHKFLQRINLYPLALIAITLVIILTNYTSGTFLSGWDTLHPEFNYSLNIERTLDGVFREEQGLGAVAAHSHMVELVRIPILGFFDLFLPTSMVRYSYIFLCLLAGPLGMYYFLKKTVIKNDTASFLGATFYLLNLGTLQTFLVPFEMFTTLYATLPWLFLATYAYLYRPTNKKLALFALIALLTSPIAYASALWYIFFASFLLFFISLSFLERKNHKGILKRLLILITVLLTTNAYWLLPNIYWALNDANLVEQARVNKVFSEEAFLKNKEFGTIGNILLLKSFYFDWGIYNNSIQTFEQLTKAFQDYYQHIPLKLLGYLIGLFCIFGYIMSFKYNRKFFIALTTLFLFSLFLLINANPPLTTIFTFLQEHIPLFKEALRRPDDKILNMFTFLMSIFFAYAALSVIKLTQKNHKSKLTQYIFTCITTLILIIYTLPFFTGNLIHPFMRVNIPKEYFQLFDYLNQQSNGRVANLPLHSPWGWTYHNWDNKQSYQGAGFLYFATPQSLLERDFDRWNPHNEQYYRELSQALYAQDQDSFKSTLEKYDVTQILLDTSVIAPGVNSTTLYYTQTEELLNNLVAEGYLTIPEKFGNNLTLYSVSQKSEFPLNTLPQATILTQPSTVYSTDSLYKTYGNYYTPVGQTGTIFPLWNLFDNEFKINKNTLSFTDESIVVNLPDQEFNLNEYDTTTVSVPATLLLETSTPEDSTLKVSLFPLTTILDNTSSIPPIRGDFEISSLSNTTLSVNNNTYQINSLLPNNPTVTDVVYLKPNNNTIAIFDSSTPTTEYSTEDTPFIPTYCDTTKDNATLLTSLQNNSLSFTKQAGDLCLITSLSFLKPSTNTQLITLTFNRNTNEEVIACLAEENKQNCSVPLSTQNVNGQTIIQFALTPQDQQNMRLLLQLNSVTGKVELNNFALTTQPSTSQTILDSTYLTPIKDITFKNLTIPKAITEDSYFQPSGTETTKNECTSTAPTKATKDIKEKNGKHYFTYTTDYGSFCDHISFNNLSHTTAYLITVTAQNHTGLPLNLCITNHTSRRCDIFAKLSKGPLITEDTFFLPPSDPTGAGYDVNIENVGIKRTPSQNDLYSVVFMPIPSSQLENIKSGTVETHTFPGAITNSKNSFPFIQLFEVSNPPALVSLSYPIHKGFNLYLLNCSSSISCALKGLFAPIARNKVTTHTTVNNWSNAWIVTEPGKYGIIFTPQLLEYLGFTLLLTLWGYIIFLLLKRPKNHN